MAEKGRTAFERALTDAALGRYQAVLDADREPVAFSAAHLAAVDRLKTKAGRKSWKLVNTTVKRVLIAAIIILLLATTAVAAIPALRAGLIRLFLRNDGVAYGFDFTREDYETAPREIETRYAPAWVPEGYALTEEVSFSNYYLQLYINDAGDHLTYAQYVLWQAGEPFAYPSGARYVLSVNSQTASIETRFVGGHEVKILRTGEENRPEGDLAVWTDHRYIYKISAVDLRDEELEQILGSMAAVDPP